MQTKDIKRSGLLNAPRLLETLWPDAESRPSLRWLREQQARRAIPYLKVSHKVYFDPEKVRESLDRKFTIESSK